MESITLIYIFDYETLTDSHSFKFWIDCTYFEVNPSVSLDVILIDGRQITLICNWNYLHLPVFLAFIFIILSVHLIFYHFLNLDLNLSTY